MDEFDKLPVDNIGILNDTPEFPIVEGEEHVIFSGAPELSPDEEAAMVEECDRQGTWAQ